MIVWYKKFLKNIFWIKTHRFFPLTTRSSIGAVISRIYYWYCRLKYKTNAFSYLAGHLCCYAITMTTSSYFDCDVSVRNVTKGHESFHVRSLVDSLSLSFSLSLSLIIHNYAFWFTWLRYYDYVLTIKSAIDCYLKKLLWTLTLTSEQYKVPFYTLNSNQLIHSDENSYMSMWIFNQVTCSCNVFAHFLKEKK